MEKTERKDLKKTLWVGLSCLIAFNIAILQALSILNPENPDESGVPYFLQLQLNYSSSLLPQIKRLNANFLMFIANQLPPNFFNGSAF